MKSTEDLFRESIGQYIRLKIDASALSESMNDITPDEILRRCNKLCNQHRDQIKIDSFIIEIMNDFGPGILKEPYVSEYNQALDIAIDACDKVSLEVGKLYKDLNLTQFRLSRETIHT